MSLLIHELIHFTISLLIGLLLYRQYKDYRLIIASLIFGVFIDLDHFIDFFLNYGLNLNLTNFFVGNYFDESGKVYVLFHGWELIPLYWLMAKFIGKKLKIKGLEWAISLAIFGHLIFDNLAYTHHPLAYFFTYRFLNGFTLTAFHG